MTGYVAMAVTGVALAVLGLLGIVRLCLVLADCLCVDRIWACCWRIYVQDLISFSERTGIETGH